MGKEKQKNITTSKSIVGLQKEQIAKMNEINEEISELNNKLATGTISLDEHERKYKKEMLNFKINNKCYELEQLKVLLESTISHQKNLENEVAGHKLEITYYKSALENIKNSMSDYDEETYKKYEHLFKTLDKIKELEKEIGEKNNEIESIKEAMCKYEHGVNAVTKDIENLNTELKKIK